jgi:hypothetical protein
MVNGNFNTGTLPPWGVFGQITHQIAAGVFEFFRPAGTPAGVVLQPVGQTMTPAQILTATFQLGNSSGVRKRVTVLVHDLNFTDLSACTFFIPPGQPLSDYAYRTYATQAWGNATISFYPSTIGTEQWMRLDNVTLRRTPGTSIVGTECIEPSSSARQLAFEAASAPKVTPAVLPTSIVPSRPYAGTDTPPSDVPADQRLTPRGFAPVPMAEDAGGAAWRAAADRPGRQTLAWAAPIDLSAGQGGRLRFESRRTGGASTAEVQVSTDGVVWQTLSVVPPTSDWTEIDIDLAAFTGRVVFMQFVFDGAAPGLGVPPDDWWIRAVSVLGGAPLGDFPAPRRLFGFRPRGF